MEEPQAEPKTVNDDPQLKQLAQDMPQPVPDAIQAAQAQDAQVKEDAKQAVETEMDFKGRKFDPNLHATDATGKPIKTPTGRFKRKIKLPDNTTSLGTAFVPPVNPNRIHAEKFANFFLVVYMTMAGEEAKPRSPEEREGLVLSWQEVFDKYGALPMEPIVGCLLVHGAYIQQRADKPNTKTILTKTFEGIKFFFINMWMRMQGKDIKVTPRKADDK